MALELKRSILATTLKLRPRLRPGTFGTERAVLAAVSECEESDHGRDRRRRRPRRLRTDERAFSALHGGTSIEGRDLLHLRDREVPRVDRRHGFGDRVDLPERHVHHDRHDLVMVALDLQAALDDGRLELLSI